MGTRIYLSAVLAELLNCVHLANFRQIVVQPACVKAPRLTHFARLGTRLLCHSARLPRHTRFFPHIRLIQSPYLGLGVRLSSTHVSFTLRPQ